MRKDEWQISELLEIVKVVLKVPLKNYIGNLIQISHGDYISVLILKHGSFIAIKWNHWFLINVHTIFYMCMIQNRKCSYTIKNIQGQHINILNSMLVFVIQNMKYSINTVKKRSQS
jgi:hypothetical protein